MAAFQDTPENWGRLDYQIMYNSPVSLYFKQEYLAKDLEWFKTENYDIKTLDCSNWDRTEDMANSLKAGLNLPDYFNGNLDALNDHLSEIEIRQTGLVVVFRHMDQLPITTLHSLLDIFSDNSRTHMLSGKRLIVFAQVDDPTITVDQIGSIPVLWNNAESSKANRLL